MDLAILKRKFPEEDIEWRIGHARIDNQDNVRASVLAYVDARAVQDRLDELGTTNVKIEHLPVIAGNELKGFLCTIGILASRDSSRIAIEEFVNKTDGADLTQIEGFKGGLSKALVRTASLWGIGRYLYELPRMNAVILDRWEEGAKKGRVQSRQGGVSVDFWWKPPRMPRAFLPEAPQLQRDEGTFVGLMQQGNWTPTILTANLKEVYQAEKVSDLSDSQYEDLCSWIKRESSGGDEHGTVTQ